MRWKNWREFKGQHSMDTVGELTVKIQELQNEVTCLNDSIDFKDAESVRSGLSHVPSQPALLPHFRDPGGMQSRSLGMPSRNDRPPDVLDTHGISGNVFANPTASSSAPYPQESNGFLTYQNTHHHMWWVNVINQYRIRDASQDRQPEIDSTLRREDFQRIMSRPTNTADFSTFACWKIRFKTEVESADDLKSSRSIRGTPGPDFELLDARIASALNRIIQNPRFKKKVCLKEMKAQKKKKTASPEEDGSLTWSTNTSRSLRPTILSRIVQIC